MTIGLDTGRGPVETVNAWQMRAMHCVGCPMVPKAQ